MNFFFCHEIMSCLEDNTLEILPNILNIQNGIDKHSTCFKMNVESSMKWVPSQ